MHMSTKTLMAREEYLQTSFEGAEPDYVDGELVERTMPNFFHGEIQVNLADAFKPWQVRDLLFRASEVRLRVAPDKFRVADFAVFSARQCTAIPEDAPYAVVEIVSPDDRFEDLMNKLADYEEAGIEFIFVADPPVRKLSRYRNGDLFAMQALELINPQVSIPLNAIFG